MHQVFLNILSNAIDAIEAKGEGGKIDISLIREGINVAAIITDDGSVINKVNIDKITDPFFSTKNPGDGVGLGLSICYSILRQHNGKLEFESELGKGTSVKITLPLKEG